MKIHFPFIALFLASAALASAAIQVTPAGLQIVWDDGADDFGGFKTLNTEKGVAIELILKSDAGTFIEISTQESKLKIGEAKADVWFFGGESSLSKDGKTARVKIQAKGAQAVDGTIPLTGEILAKTANKKAETESAVLELKKGEKLSFGKESGLPEFVVEKLGKPEFGGEGFAVTLKCKKDFQKFVSVKFVEEDGTEHPAEREGWSRMGFGKVVTIEVGYKMSKKLDKAKMVVEYWADLEETKVPVDLKLGLDGTQP